MPGAGLEVWRSAALQARLGAAGTDEFREQRDLLKLFWGIGIIWVVL